MNLWANSLINMWFCRGKQNQPSVFQGKDTSSVRRVVEILSIHFSLCSSRFFTSLQVAIMALQSLEHEPFLHEDYKESIMTFEPTPASPQLKWTIKALLFVAIVSTFGNVIWMAQTLKAGSIQPPNDSPKACREQSLYAGLERDIPIPFRDDTIFSPHNRSLSDAAWDQWVVDPGIVALPHDWVKAKMLPQAQRWPWDKEKGVYLLNGFHNIHCLVNSPS
jgi:hypothetical protein